MNNTEKIREYLTSHPLQSDKKLAKKLGINRREVERIRTVINQPETSHTSHWYDHPLLSGKYFYLNLFLLALLIRLIYQYFLKINPLLTEPILDAQYYLKWAKEIVSQGWLGKKVFFTEPLYAYLLAFIIRIGLDPSRTMIVIQNVLGCILPIINYKITQKVFNKPIAVISSLITAIYGPFIFYENLILKTTLETFLLALFILTIINLLSNKISSPWRIFYSGLILGIVVIVKGNALVLAPLILFFIIKKGHNNLKARVLSGLVFGLGMLVFILPVTIRNYIVEKDFVLTNYSIGMNIYQGNWWDTDGSLLQPPFIQPDPRYEETDSHNMAESYSGKPLKPSQVSSFWFKKAVEEIASNPSRWIAIIGKKLLLLITKVELADNYDYSFFKKNAPVLSMLPDFWLVASFSITAIILLIFTKDMKSYLNDDAKLTRKQIFFLAIIGIYALFTITGHVNSRYREPLIPYFISLASVLIWYLAKKLTAEDYFKTALTVLIIGINLIITSVHLENFDFMSDANFYNNIGSNYLDNNQDLKAEQYFRKANDVDKKFAYAYSNLFSIYMKHGLYQLAKQQILDYINLRPDDVSGYQNLKLYDELKEKPLSYSANRIKLNKEKTDKRTADKYDWYFTEATRFLKIKNFQKAQYYLELSAKNNNKPENTMVNLALLFKTLKKIDKAKEILIDVSRSKPFFLPAKYNLANIYYSEKKYQEAAKYLQDIYNIFPEYMETWFFLGASYINSKNFDAALPIVSGFVKRYEKDQVKKEQVDIFKSRLVPASSEAEMGK